MADPLPLKEIRRRLAELQEWEVKEIVGWLQSKPPSVAYILPRIDSISGEAHGDITRRQIERGKEDSENGGQYSEVVRDMYGLDR